MIADMLLEAKRPQQALVEYQTDLKFNPNRFNGLYGAARAAEAAGKQSEANEYYALLLKDCAGSNSTRPGAEPSERVACEKVSQGKNFIFTTSAASMAKRAEQRVVFAMLPI